MNLLVFLGLYLLFFNVEMTLIFSGVGYDDRDQDESNGQNLK